MKFQQKPHKKTKDKKSFIEKLREEEQMSLYRDRVSILQHQYFLKSYIPSNSFLNPIHLDGG